MSSGPLRQTGGAVTLGSKSALHRAELQGCTLRLPETRTLSWTSAHLVDCHAQGGDLGSLQDCRLRGASLNGVRIHSLVACDLRHAALTRVDLRGADLRGARLQGATLLHCQLDGVQAQGARLDGVQGLSAHALEALYAAGALRPKPVHKRLWAGLALLLALPLLPLALLPGQTSSAVVASQEDWVLGPDAVEQTQSGLQDFRAGIAAAHLQLDGRGGRSFPTLEEVQANHYDLDGDGPGQALGVLFPKGLPRNLLSPSEGSVLPYCNRVPDQATLGEEDVDWHYCPETGRVLASAGHTAHPTVNW